MFRTTLISVVVACAMLFATTASADITVNEKYAPWDCLVAKVDTNGIPPKALVRGTISITGKASFWQPNPDKLEYGVWAEPGKHTITASGMWVVTDTGALGGKLVDFGMYTFSKDFVVEGEVKPDPPNPPDPPKPGGPYQLLLFYDRDQLDDLPAPQRALLTSEETWKKLQDAGHRVAGIFSAQSVTGLTPSSKWKPFIAAVERDPLPRLAVASLDEGYTLLVNGWRERCG